MRHYFAAAIASTLLCCSADLSAQWRPEPVIGTGFTTPFSTNFDPGLHLFAGLEWSRARVIHVRADVLLEQTRVRNLSTLGSLLYAPSHRAIAPYLILGGGVYLEHGINPLIAGGIGVNLTSAWRAPLIVETRLLSGPDTHVVLTLAVRP